MKNRTPLTLIFLTVFIDLLGFGILIPILPTFATVELHLDETSIGFIVAVYSLLQFIFNPIFGRLSDKYGRRPLIIVSLFLNAVGYIVFAFTHSFIMLTASRVIAGIGGSSIGVAQAYIADVTTKENRSKGMGMIGAAFGLGFVFGPLIGGFLSGFGYAVTGYGSAFFSFSACLLTLFFLPESHLRKEEFNKPVRARFAARRVDSFPNGSPWDGKRKILDIKSLRAVFDNPASALMIALFFVLTFSMANIYGTFSLLGYKIYHFSNLQNGYMYGILGLFSAIVQGGLINRLEKFIGQKKLITLGSILMMAGLALLPYGVNFFGLVLVVIILAFGTGILQPTILSLLSVVTPDSEQGITLGVNQSLSSLARVFGPFWGGFSFEFLGYQWPFLTGAAFTAIVVLASIFYLPGKLKLQSESSKIISDKIL